MNNKLSGEKIFLIGIPHLNWKLINLMTEKGKLKNFNKLKKQGSYGIIYQQQDICSTPVEFTSMVTGVKKEKHQIGQGKRSDKEYVKDGKLYTRESINAKTIWDIALDQKMSVGIYHWLLTWPPKKINGFMITGRLCQDLKNKTYPKELTELLDEKERKFDFFNSEVAFKLIKKYDIDLFLGMDEQMHGSIHVLWEYVEPNKNIREDRLKLKRGELFRKFEEFDKFLGKILEEFSNSTIIAVGDSGMRLRKYPIYTLGRESFELFEKLDIDIQLYAYDIYPPFLPKAKPTLTVPGKEPEEKEKISKKLSKIECKNSGEPFIKNVKWNKDSLSFDFNFHPSWIDDRCNWLYLTLPDGEELKIWVTKQTGAAFPKGGTFLAKGPSIKDKNFIGRVDTVDLAPTILHLLDLPIPKEVDGKILKELFI